MRVTTGIQVMTILRAERNLRQREEIISVIKRGLEDREQFNF